jgi:hypothetical protein
MLCACAPLGSTRQLCLEQHGCEHCSVLLLHPAGCLPEHCNSQAVLPEMMLNESRQHLDSTQQSRTGCSLPLSQCPLDTLSQSLVVLHLVRQLAAQPRMALDICLL